MKNSTKLKISLLLILFSAFMQYCSAQTKDIVITDNNTLHLINFKQMTVIKCRDLIVEDEAEALFKNVVIYVERNVIVKGNGFVGLNNTYIVYKGTTNAESEFMYKYRPNFLVKSVINEGGGIITINKLGKTIIEGTYEEIKNKSLRQSLYSIYVDGELIEDSIFID